MVAKISGLPQSLGFQEAGSVMEETAIAIPFILRANINTTIAELMAPRHHSTFYMVLGGWKKNANTQYTCLKMKDYVFNDVIHSDMSNTEKKW